MTPSGPQSIMMAIGDRKSSAVAIFRLMDQCSIGPSGVLDQSNDLINDASSPGPLRKPVESGDMFDLLVSVPSSAHVPSEAGLLVHLALFGTKPPARSHAALAWFAYFRQCSRYATSCLPMRATTLDQSQPGASSDFDRWRSSSFIQRLRVALSI
jgi:hypothetical protein